ncbi:hypothetical protein RF11_08392 [Thelohanellus kitauei]|uniref:MULE transposase domain-containing protein n=1 Tax=Thelohanellus kitauei TaxID=669202 RepID=A0A0C2N0Z6_THEKT|nr:hypothetical protein RF11_08392 [Thelohanellus kitauei]
MISSVVPVLYAIMPNKRQQTYEELMNILHQHVPQINVIRIVSDFEIAALNAIRHHFPSAIISGCFYHFSQSIWRKIQSEDPLLSQYRSDPDNQIYIKMLLALAFVPIDDVISAFEVYQSLDYVISNSDILNPLLDYFEDNYIGRFTANNLRRQPPFPINIWNMFDATLNDLHRTNNSVEGWHNGFSKILMKVINALWQFKTEMELPELTSVENIGNQTGD